MPARRPAVRVFALGLVMLGVCVFAWGLRYKLSLYAPPHSIAHCMPAAKLLVGKERLEFAAVHPLRAQDVAAPLSFAVLFLASFVRMRSTFQVRWNAWALRVPEKLPVLRLAGSAAEFVRPPPSLR
ncbi:MAG TPA: hypothetical protein VMD25_04335 [Acidobacteriaceae bacterium]|nr:hypothetical protein [Acidobacteriaceae bacterium]